MEAEKEYGNLADFQIENMRKYGNAVALVDARTDKSYTYTEVIHRIECLAAGLKYIGVRQGDVLCALMFNTIEYPIVWYAVNMLGATFMTASPQYTDEELERRFMECATKFLLTTPELSIRVRKILRLSSHRRHEFVDKMVVLGTAENCISYDTLFTRGRLTQSTIIDPATSDSILLSSSGTTGLPKFVRLAHRNIIVNLPQIRELYQHQPGMAAILCLPMFHHYGAHCALSAGLYNGVQLVVMERFQIDEFLTLIQKHKAEILQVVPTIADRLVKHSGIDKYDLSSVKYVQSGAAPIGIEIATKLQQLFKLNYLNICYGLTECGVISGNTPSCNRRGSNGVNPKGVLLKISDPDTGETLPANQRGEIRVKGPQVTVGYLNQPEVTRLSFDKENFFKTGDIGYLDSDGYLFIVDRLKELIKYKGQQVAPAYLEDLLMKHPDIADAAVVGVPDQEAGELPKAFVVRQPWSHITENTVINFIRGVVSPHMRLRGGVEFIDQIPRNPSGKIMRRFLRERGNKQAKL